MRSTSTAFDSSGKGRRMAGSPLNPQRRSRSTGYRWERDRRGIVAGTLNQTRSHCRQSGFGSAGEDSEGRSCGGRLTGIWRGFPPGGPGSFLAGGGQGGCRRRRGGGVEMVGTVATGRGGRPLHATRMQQMGQTWTLRINTTQIWRSLLPRAVPRYPA